MAQKPKKNSKGKNVAYVHNPSELLPGLSGAKKTNMKSNGKSSKGKKTTTSKKGKGRKSNPDTTKPVKKNPSNKRKSNPSGVAGLLGAALVAGIGVSVFDAVMNRVAPTSSGTIRAGLKLAGAYAVQTWGGKIPIIKDWNKEIALVLAVLGFVDIFKIHILPLLNSVTGGALNFLSPMPMGADAMEMAGNYTYEALPAFEDEEEVSYMGEEEYA